ncbi:hypothetical protein CYMTET_29990 [Cymbomonas tetramitiformis]|uniref:Mitochondrial carrier protein n=1 Tax=Cymbomonas tetramitiformis TaxID=36881 RepID=A0AAE0KUD4_9CHLO|nr:hypothetical protein CYMTET_29990 [Cymbomonas tetramitiformis]
MSSTPAKEGASGVTSSQTLKEDPIDSAAAGASRALLRQKLVALLARPRWRYFVPQKYSPGWGEVAASVTATFRETYERAQRGKGSASFTTRHLPKSHNFLRQTIVPVAANTIGGVVLFETFEELLRRQEPLWRGAGGSKDDLVPAGLLATIIAGGGAGALHAAAMWPLDKFLLPGQRRFPLQGWEHARSGEVWRSVRRGGHAADLLVVLSRDAVGFAVFFGVYERAKMALLELHGEQPERPKQDVFGWPQGELPVRLSTTMGAGVSSGVVYGAISQPFELLRKQVQQRFHVKRAPSCQKKADVANSIASQSSAHGGAAPGAAGTTQYSQTQRAQITYGSPPKPSFFLKHIRSFFGNIIRAAPANGMAIVVYELARIQFDDTDSEYKG